MHPQFFWRGAGIGTPVELVIHSDITWLWLTVPGAVLWGGLLVLPWRPWLNREKLEPACQRRDIDLSDVTVLIPARNEAQILGSTLAGLRDQGRDFSVVVIDDQSSDATAEEARKGGADVLDGMPLPVGWAGKLWALEQGLGKVRTPLTLLLDADIQLAPGILQALLLHKQQHQLNFVSLMADMRRTSFWDRLLLPAFVYYFRLLYPFALSNSSSRLVAAAAGGCVLVDTDALRNIGGFAALRGSLIDDCSLARHVKDAGYRTWIGLSRGVISMRPYGALSSIHEMVARSAYTQLRYSPALLIAVTILFGFAYWVPVVAFFLAHSPVDMVALFAMIAMMVSYLPILYYYRESPYFAFLLPFTGSLYLAMTWSSAIRYFRGIRSDWRGRRYAR